MKVVRIGCVGVCLCPGPFSLSLPLCLVKLKGKISERLRVSECVHVRVWKCVCSDCKHSKNQRVKS